MEAGALGWFAFPIDDSDKVLAALDALQDLIWSDVPDNTMFEMVVEEVDDPCMN